MSPLDQQRRLLVSVLPPASSEVEYYNTITLTFIITNVSNYRILIEDVALRFQSDYAPAALKTGVACTKELDPGGVHDVQIEVTPTPLYKEFTNVFDIRIQYRITDSGTIGDPQFELYPSKSYIIIREPQTPLGQIFISLKQPEDLYLGHLMTRMARRAGLLHFLKDDNRRLSEDIWRDTIEPALRSSQACIVIWTDNTNWIATGVEREISFCRKNNIPEALFLEQNSAVPQLYKGSLNEYMRFDGESPGKIFVTGLENLRHRLQGRT